MPYNTHVRRELDRLLKHRGWTKRELGERARIARTVVIAHLAGRRRIGARYIVKYASAFNPSHAARTALRRAWERDCFPKDMLPLWLIVCIYLARQLLDWWLDTLD